MKELTREKWTAPVPPMTHPLASGWGQPDPNQWAFDDKYVVMPEQDFRRLPAYNTSRPTGVYEGKMWRSQWIGARHGQGYVVVWYLCWYDDPIQDRCPVQLREILLA